MPLRASSQLRTWSFGQLRPVYLTSQPSTCAENRTVMRVRHCTHFVMLFLCIPHHLSGVAFKASSIANKHCCIGTLSSKSDKKVSNGFRPSKVSKLLTIVSIQCTSPVNLLHLLADNSYFFFFQFSSASSESDEHALSLHQLIFPSIVGLM
jgi:hypothetical protein